MDAILETSPHYHSALRKRSVCWGGGEPRLGKRGFFERGPFRKIPCSQNHNAKRVRTSPIPGELQAQRSELHSESAAPVGKQ